MSQLPTKYYDADTITLAEELLPIELVGKTKLEIKRCLTEDNDLRAKLNYFGAESKRAKTVRQEGRFYGVFNIPWVTVSGKRQLLQWDIIRLNNFIFTTPDPSSVSNFAYSVLVSVDITSYVVFSRTQAARKKCFCKRFTDSGCA